MAKYPDKKLTYARKVIKQIAENHSEGTLGFAKEIHISKTTLYDFISGDSNNLSDQNAEKIIDYCLSKKIKLKMRDLRPHINLLLYK